jgi:hypothetical protein
VTTPPGPPDSSPDDATAGTPDGAAHHSQFGDRNRQVNAHEYVENNYYSAAPPGPTPAQLTWPLVLGSRPPLRADGYLDRPQLREAVAFTPGRTVIVSGTRSGEAGEPGTGSASTVDPVLVSGVTRVVCGDGGIGKTQLAAAAYTGARAAGADLVMWVSATSRDAIVSAYAQALPAVAPGRATGTDPERDAAGFLSWLDTTTRSWFLVLDDLTDPADLDRLWPTGLAGQVSVTTRRRDASLRGHGRRLVEVDVFTPGQALAYLTGKLTTAPGLPADVLDQAADLAADLGHLPVALAQGAAVIIDQVWTCTEYRAHLADRTMRMSELFTGSGDDYQHTLASAWSLTLDHAATQHPAGLVTPLAWLIAVLDANGIPETVLTTTAARDYLTGALAEVSDQDDAPGTGRDTDAGRIRAGLRAAHRFSLITHDPGAGPRAVRMHAIAQRAILDPLAPAQVDRLIRVAADALDQAWPQVENDPALSQTLRTNTTTLVGHDTRHTLWAWGDGGAHPLLFRPTRSLGETGAVTDALQAAEALHEQALHRLGPDHPNALTTRANLAHWRGAAGDPAGAAAAFAALLADRLRMLGLDHTDTLSTRGDLAYWRGRAGDPAGAAAAFADLLTDQLRILGPDHPDTLTTRGNLARSRGLAGDRVGAAAGFADLLTDQLRILGPDHPQTLIARHDAAWWRGYAGDWAGAAAMFEELLDDRLRVLGADHPDTLATRHSAARWRGQAGDPADAAEAMRMLLRDRLRILGPDHPDTLITRSNIAWWTGKAGDPAGAVAAGRELLADRLRVLGADHPDTLTTRHDLAYWRGQAGDPAGAAAGFADVLADRLRVLGPDHPDTLATRHEIAQLRGQAGDLAGAAVAFADVLADRLRVLGPDHPDTLATRHEIAQLRGQAGDPTGAAVAFADLLADRLRVLGPDHPDTLTTRRNLAHW